MQYAAIIRHRHLSESKLKKQTKFCYRVWMTSRKPGELLIRIIWIVWKGLRFHHSVWLIWHNLNISVFNIWNSAILHSLPWPLRCEKVSYWISVNYTVQIIVSFFKSFFLFYQFHIWVYFTFVTSIQLK